MDRFGQHGDRLPSPAAHPRSRSWPNPVMSTSREVSAGSAMMASRSSTPSMSGMNRSRSATANGRPSFAAARIVASADSPESAVLTIMPQSVRYSDKTLALRGVVVDDQGGDAGEAGIGVTRGSSFLLGVGMDADREPEGASDPEPARHAAVAAHERDQLAADREPQPRAAVLPRGGRVGLDERLEDELELVGRDAVAGVGDLEADDRVGRRSASAAVTRTTISPARVNLMALPMRLVRTWRTRPGSPLTDGRDGALDDGDQLETLGLRRARRAGRRRRRRRSARRTRCPRSRACPASTFEKSRMSLMMVSSASPELRTVCA